VLQSHLFEYGFMKPWYVRIGDKCSVGNLVGALRDIKMNNGSSWGPLFLLMKRQMVAALDCRHGIPTGRVEGPSSI
jgi:hypothetical protein